MKANDEEAASDLGFPFTATKNTTRVGGGDAIADVAGVAGAVWPATSDTTHPKIVVLVDKDNWQGGVAASVFAGGSFSAPLLLSDDDNLPAVSEDTLDRLDPKGSDAAKGAAVIRIGSRPPEPGGYKTTTIDGDDVYELAAEIDRFHTVATGEPSLPLCKTLYEDAVWFPDAPRPTRLRLLVDPKHANDPLLRCAETTPP